MSKRVCFSVYGSINAKVVLFACHHRASAAAYRIVGSIPHGTPTHAPRPQHRIEPEVFATLQEKCDPNMNAIIVGTYTLM